MGTGEPFDNYDNVMNFLATVNHDRGLGIGSRHITISTCGIVPRIYDFANEHGLKHILAVDMHHMGIKKTADIIRETVGNNPVMVTFDIDFVDPMFAPGTGTPVPGGFTSFETLELIRLALTGLNTVGFDLVEVAPNYDPSEITELLASRIVHEFIALLACKKAGITEYAYRGKE